MSQFILGISSDKPTFFHVICFDNKHPIAIPRKFGEFLLAFIVYKPQEML